MVGSAERPRQNDGVERVEIAIVGAGTAGLAALREVRKETDDFVLINAAPYGTTCARVGCMPSKALIAAANAFHARVNLNEFGIRGGEALAADIPAVLCRVRALRDHFVASVLSATEDLGPHNIEGHARLDGPNRLIVGDRVIEAQQIVLATGSSPIVPEPWRALGDRILTSDSLFEQEDLPPRIGVIGRGAIGVEIAQALARLGLEVHGFDGGERMAGISDQRVAQVARDTLAAESSIHLGVKVELVEADGGIEMRWSGGSVVVDKVIAAVGRRPNVVGLGLETLGVPLDEKGMPKVDRSTMRIASTPVLLAGDANGEKPLLHEGADDGHIAGLNATSEDPLRFGRRVPLSVVFCDPEVVSVGQSTEELEPEAILTSEVNFRHTGSRSDHAAKPRAAAVLCGTSGRTPARRRNGCSGWRASWPPFGLGDRSGADGPRPAPNALLPSHAGGGPAHRAPRHRARVAAMQPVRPGPLWSAGRGGVGIG